MANGDRITLRLDLAPFEREAERLGVETGGLVREAAVVGLGLVSREVSAGRVKLRRRSGSPVSPAPECEPSVPASVPAAPPSLSRAEAFRAAAARRSSGG